jgi:hypothetical protein
MALLLEQKPKLKHKKKKKDGSYPNDIIRERCVCYSHALYIVLLMCVIKSLLLTYLTDALTFNTTYMRD